MQIVTVILLCALTVPATATVRKPFPLGDIYCGGYSPRNCPKGFWCEFEDVDHTEPAGWCRPNDYYSTSKKPMTVTTTTLTITTRTTTEIHTYWCGGLHSIPCDKDYVCDDYQKGVTDAMGRCRPMTKEELMQCGDYVGRTCPAGHWCKMPERVYADAVGTCQLNDSTTKEPLASTLEPLNNYNMFCAGFFGQRCPWGYTCYIREEDKQIMDAFGICMVPAEIPK